MSVIDAIIARKLCGGGGGGSVPKPLTYDYMPEGYPTKSVQTTTLMEEQELEFAHVTNGVYAAFLTDRLALVPGQTYTVKWDGTEYECVCFDDGKDAYFGNTSIMGWGEDTGEPFSYLPDDGAFATLDTSASHTISVKRTGETVTPMAEEFLPTGVTAAAIDNAQTAADNAQTAADNAQTAADNAQTAADNAQTAANSNKEVLDCAFSSVATFTFDKQTSGRDTFAFNAYDYYKISGFNPSPSDVISFTGTRESGDELSKITIGNNCVEYGFFIIVASAGVCSLPVTETATRSFTAPSAGLYAKYCVDLPFQTAGTGEFTLREATGSFSITGLLLKSSTANSTKKFKITVEDSGTISATEVT